jgi:hypothetical protein
VVRADEPAEQDVLDPDDRPDRRVLCAVYERAARPTLLVTVCLTMRAVVHLSWSPANTCRS